ncbi:unnamed protein product, partial [Brassica oleracea]
FIFLVALLHEVYIAMAIYSSMFHTEIFLPMNSFEYASARQSWDPQHCQSIFLLETHGTITLLTFFLLSP